MKAARSLVSIGVLLLLCLPLTSVCAQTGNKGQSATSENDKDKKEDRISVKDATDHLIYKVDPVYPSVAKKRNIEGEVALEIVISKEGGVMRTQVLSGHPLLKRAAMEAVKKYRYKPFKQNGQAVEAITTISIPFSLSGSVPTPEKKKR